MSAKQNRHNVRKTDGPRGVRWHATVDLGRDPLTGKRRQKRVTALTRKALDQKIAALLTDPDQGKRPAADTMTVASFLTDWAATLDTTMRPSSANRYRRIVTGTLLPMIGDLRLARLTAFDIQRLETELGRQGYAPASVRLVHVVLHKALGSARKWGLIAANPCADVDAPRRSEPEFARWSLEEARRFLAAAAGHDYEALWRMAITTGMRRGELLGLRWQDVDLARGVLTIRHTMILNAGGTLTPGTPKTKRGQRSVTIGRHDIAALERQRDRQQFWEPSPLGLVFTTPAGRHLTPQRLRRMFDELTDRAGVPRIRFHDCRHTNASLLMEANEHPKAVQDRLGHSTLAETMRYSHLSPAMQRGTAERMDSLIDGDPDATSGSM